jgi:hypothetical protein
MNYTVFLFVFTLLSFFLNELILIPFLLLASNNGHLRLKLSSINLLYISAVVLSILVSIFYNFLDFDLNLGIHLALVIILTVFIRDEQFNVKHLILIAKIFLIVNIVIVALDATQFNLNLSFTSHSIPRFKSIFLEPSVASFTFILTLILLYNYDKKLSFWILLNLIFILITFSGSGYAIIFLLSLFTIKFKIRKKTLILSVVLIILTLPALYYFTKSESFQFLIAKRINRIDQGSDNSSKLRFLAPLQVAEFTLKNSPIWGFGLGSAEKTINANRSSFSYFKHFDGTPTSKINNVYAIILIAGGFTLLFIHFIFLYSIYKYVIPKSIHFYIFLLVFPIFSGHYANIFMWTIAYLIIHLKDDYQREKKTELNTIPT